MTLALIPLFPLLSAALLILSQGRMPRMLAALLGVGSVGLSALCVALAARQYLAEREVQELLLWTWMAVGDFTPRVAFYVDGLTVVMMSVITGVGFLIHLYSVEFMGEDDSFCRYFAYMNLFVASMLVLVLADNLLLLVLLWCRCGYSCGVAAGPPVVSMVVLLYCFCWSSRGVAAGNPVVLLLVLLWCCCFSSFYRSFLLILVIISYFFVLTFACLLNISILIFLRCLFSFFSYSSFLFI